MKNKRSVSVLGSTGSIGTQTLEICAAHGFPVRAIAAAKNIDLLERQAREFQPELCAVYDEDAAGILKQRLSGTGIKVLAGMEGLIRAAEIESADIVVTAVMGMVGLVPTLAAIDRGKRIALANKETLVAAGELVLSRASVKRAEIIPVDSEHSAVFQCLQAAGENRMKKLILTASGGPFFGRKPSKLENITLNDALKHPNWSMGAKITVDSATLMNKGLEFIEAMRLFKLSPDDIQVVVHRESIIHSAIEFEDGSVIAQLGLPDMRIPIQYAITYPQRLTTPCERLDLVKCGKMTFYEPDEETFKCLKLAKTAAKRGGLYCAALNAANERAVELFMEGSLSFTGIADAVEYALSHDITGSSLYMNDIISADRSARESVDAFAAKVRQEA